MPRTGLSNLLFVRRKASGLSKRDVALELGVSPDVVGQWERGEHLPRVKYVPALVAFLKNDSWLPSSTFSERVRRFRALRGWCRSKLAAWIGVDARTIGRWENGAAPPVERQHIVDRQMLEASIRDPVSQQSEGALRAQGRSRRRGMRAKPAGKSGRSR
ncbi:helix-turn-helix domain-containing protein [Maricaulis sp. CAU 1757]